MLALAGFFLLAIGLPAAMALTALALWEESVPPALPALVAGPPILLGYLACHFASNRLVKARAADESRR